MVDESRFFAHSVPGKSQEFWQPLDVHLQNVAKIASEFASEFGAGKWGYAAGIWHDLGKYSFEFQRYIEHEAEACAETLPGKVDHSSAGAQHAVSSIEVLGHLIGYTIAGHHAGLLDGRSDGAASQEKRLQKETKPWSHGLSELPEFAGPEPPEFVKKALVQRDAMSVAFFCRMLFSCLVDADFLDTERFLDPEKWRLRRAFPSFRDIIARVEKEISGLETSGQGKDINVLRRSVREDCERAADLAPGIFSLTVPTGGGKTLSSLVFALRHAIRHGLHRVVYVIPFTTIIEQNADVFRQYAGRESVLEHHSDIDPEKESAAHRLAAENWDAPIVVTTSVQFYESLFANRSSRCRKLHNLAKSVVILDEAQTIPVDYLKPCLRSLSELASNYGTTVVLCTATQPAIGKRPDFDIGLSGVREIVSNPASLYSRLQRVRIEHIGRKTDDELKERLLRHDKALCIVNTVRHARTLFEMLGAHQGHFHLSARMCPAHRRVRLKRIREALAKDEVCRVVSTQVVEAGVDLDFPVVYRSLAGLDSIAQAAGRCNRNNLLSEKGNVFVFTTEHPASERYFADTANCASQIMELKQQYPDPLDMKANEHYFKLYYWDQKQRWDKKAILDEFHLASNDRRLPFQFNFATAARNFRLIDDDSTCGVIVPWDDEGKEVCRLLHHAGPSRELLRRAQAYLVNVFRAEWMRHADRDIELLCDNLGILRSPETHYNPDTGLNLEAEGPGIYLV